MRLLWRLLARDAAEFSRSPALLVLVLVVPLLLLLLIGQLNVRPTITRVAIVVPAGDPAAIDKLRERLREIASIESVDWPADVGDPRDRAVRDGVDVVLVLSQGAWRAYSAVTLSARAASTQETAQLLMLALQREAQVAQQLERLHALKAALPAPAASTAAPAAADQPDAAAGIVGEIERSVREQAALPTPLLGVWLWAQISPLFAAASAVDHALVPAYIALIAVFVPFVLASATLVREREAGTLAGLLIVTRRRWAVLAAGKLLLPLLAGMLAFALLLVAARLAFGFGIKPGLAQALLTQALAALVSALFGLGVSSLLESAQEAYAASAVYLVALILLTGMVHSLEQSAPVVVAVAHLFPLTLAAPALETWMAAGAAAYVPPRTWLVLGLQGLAALLLCALALRRLRARL